MKQLPNNSKKNINYEINKLRLFCLNFDEILFRVFTLNFKGSKRKNKLLRIINSMIKKTHTNKIMKISLI